MGPAADDALSRAQLALLRRSRARALRRDLHHAGLSVSLFVLLHPGAVQGWRAGARAARRGRTAIVSGRRTRSSRRSICWSTNTASGTSSSPTRCSCSTSGTSSASAICIIERGYDLNIWAYARVDTVKDDMLDKLKRAGFNWLALGIEAADDRVLTDVDKRYEVDEVYDTVATHQGRPASTSSATTSSGCPRTTLDTMQRHARPGARAELRVRELLFRDGVPRLAAVRGSDSPAAGGCPTPGAGTRSIRWTRCRCRRGTCSAGEVLQLPRSRLRHLLQARAVS